MGEVMVAVSWGLSSDASKVAPVEAAIGVARSSEERRDKLIEETVIEGNLKPL
jgi:hypothetical protein